MFQVNPQPLFSSKDKSKKLKCRQLQFLFGALRANCKNDFTSQERPEYPRGQAHFSTPDMMTSLVEPALAVSRNTSFNLKNKKLTIYQINSYFHVLCMHYPYTSHNYETLRLIEFSQVAYENL